MPFKLASPPIAVVVLLAERLVVLLPAEVARRIQRSSRVESTGPGGAMGGGGGDGGVNGGGAMDVVG